MELGSSHVVARDRSRDHTAIIGGGDHILLALRIEKIRMDEIRVQAGVAGGDAGEQGMVLFHVNRVPADLGYLQGRVGRRHLPYITLDPAKSFGDGLFKPARRHQLHADAYAQEWDRPALHSIDDRLDHAVDRLQSRAAIGISAHTRQNHAIRSAYTLGVIGQVYVSCNSCFARRALERLGGGAQISRTVVDDGYAHRHPFVG